MVKKKKKRALPYESLSVEPVVLVALNAPKLHVRLSAKEFAILKGFKRVRIVRESTDEYDYTVGYLHGAGISIARAEKFGDLIVSSPWLDEPPFTKSTPMKRISIRNGRFCDER